MSMTSRVPALAAVALRLVPLVLSLCSLAALVRSSPAGAEGGLQVHINQVDTSQFPQVTATLSVVDQTGVPVRGLQLHNFQVSAGGAQLPVLELTPAVDSGIGIGVVLVIDVSGSMQGAPLAMARQVARDYVSRLGPGDQAALVTFSNGVNVVQEMTADKNALFQAIDRLQAAGNTALYDAVVAAVGRAAAAPLPRRAVILLSDGEDFGGLSRASRASSLEAAARSGVPVFSVGLGQAPDQGYLNELAALTQGQAYFAPDPAALPPLYDGIQNLLRAQYVLRVDFGQGARAGQYQLQVTVRSGEASGVGQRSFEALPPGYRPPQLSLPGLQAGQRLEAPLLLIPSVSASEAVTVRYLLDGGLLQERGSPPYEHLLDPVSLSPGPHSLRVEVRDAVGGSAALEVPLTVAAVPPRLRILGPRGELGQEAGETLKMKGATTLEAQVQAQRPVRAVRFYLGDILLAELTSPPFSVTLDPAAYPEEGVELLVTAEDEGGQEGRTSVRLQVASDGWPVSPLLVATVGGPALVALAAAGAGLWWRQRRRRDEIAVPPPREAATVSAVPEAGPPEAPPVQEDTWPSGPLARLIVRGPGMAEPLTVELAREPLTIGSGPGCGLQLQGQGIAPRQVRIWYRDGKFMLHDLTPEGGTLVSGQRVFWAVLEQGDEIQIGPYFLRFEEMTGWGASRSPEA